MKRSGSTRNALGLAAILAALAWSFATSVAADDDAPPAVGLDQLLKIPPTVSFEPTKRGHSTKAEWRERFDQAHGDVAKAHADLAETQAKLSEIGNASSAWMMGAPGLPNVDREFANEAPLDQALSREMKRHREEVERSERRLRELEVEANLAQVPEDWRGTPQPEAAAPQAMR